MSHRSSPLSLTLVFGALAGAWTLLPAEPVGWTPAGYTIEVQVEVPVGPEAAWDHFTGDVSPWWDHHLAKEPKSLTIGREPGSSFVEVFDEAGHGAEHARVTHAMRGQMLRMVGPLGLVGHGVEIDATLRFGASAGGTLVQLTAHLTGKVDEPIAKTVEKVWQHFLVERYAPYVRKQ